MKVEATTGKAPNEDRVRNAVVGLITSQGYTNNLQIKSGDQQGADICANHQTNEARRIVIEAKGDSPRGNKTIAIYTAWGQLASRVSSVNLNRIHGLAFPLSWESNVAKLSSHQIAKFINVHYYFVSNKGTVTEYTATQFRKKHKK